jgi:hypothetical protein
MSHDRGMSIRRALVVAAAIAVPVSAVVVGGEIAGAANPRLGTGPAKHDSINCKAMGGTLSFSRPLKTAGYTTGASEVTTVRASLVSCTVAGPYHVIVKGGLVTGTLTSNPPSSTHPVGECVTGSTDETGALSTAWNPPPYLNAYPSVVHVKSVHVGTHAGYATFTIPGSVANAPTAGGSFAGPANTGAFDRLVAQTVLKVAGAGGIQAKCATTAGISSLAIHTETAPVVDPISLNS